MAGHSKWANIKHRKDRQDKKRGAEFTKLAKAITVAAREGGDDPEMNFALRLAVDKARAANMPNDNIERAIQRGVGGVGGDDVERLAYEGYGPASAAIIVECTTDNRNRTVGQIRSTFTKYGGNLGESGSVGWQFVQRGTIMIPAAELDAEEVMLEAIDLGAVDVEVDADTITVHTEVGDFAKVKTALTDAGYDTGEAELAMIPTTPVDLDVKQIVSVLKFVERLEDLDDVDKVWTNVTITDEAIEAYDAA